MTEVPSPSQRWLIAAIIVMTVLIIAGLLGVVYGMMNVTEL